MPWPVPIPLFAVRFGVRSSTPGTRDSPSRTADLRPAGARLQAAAETPGPAVHLQSSAERVRACHERRQRRPARLCAHRRAARARRRGHRARARGRQQRGRADRRVPGQRSERGADRRAVDAGRAADGVRPDAVRRPRLDPRPDAAGQARGAVHYGRADRPPLASALRSRPADQVIEDFPRDALCFVRPRRHPAVVLVPHGVADTPSTRQPIPVDDPDLSEVPSKREGANALIAFAPAGLVNRGEHDGPRTCRRAGSAIDLYRRDSHGADARHRGGPPMATQARDDHGEGKHDDKRKQPQPREVGPKGGLWRPTSSRPHAGDARQEP